MKHIIKQFLFLFLFIGHFSKGATKKYLVKTINRNNKEKRIPFEFGKPHRKTSKKRTNTADKSLLADLSESKYFLNTGSLFEGDILLSEADLLIGGQGSDYSAKLNGQWEKGIVNYFLQGNWTEEEKDKILSAMEELSNKTCVTFSNRVHQNLVFIVKNQNNCFSNIGMKGGWQFLNLGAKCMEHIM